MKAADYVANERLTNRAGDVVAAAGASCENVDPKSLPWLLEGGYIRPAAEGERKKAKPSTQVAAAAETEKE